MILSWGKPRIFIKDLDVADAKWQEVPTPVEDSTQLSTTKGDKKEAKVEGGENEDVKYNKNTYALVFNIRQAKNRKKPISDSDGIIMHNYAVALQPEDPTIEGFVIDKSAVSIEDTWTSADGGVWIYTFDALKADKGDQVKWGTVAVTGSGESLVVDFTPNEDDAVEE